MRTKIMRTALIAILGGLLALVYYLSPVEMIREPRRVLEWAQNLDDSEAALFTYFLIYCFGNFLFIPIPLITLAGSTIFPLWKSLACGVVGTLTSALIGYAAGRLFDVSHWPRHIRNVALQLRERLEKREGWAVLALRLAPTPPFFVTSLISGSCRIPWTSFALGSIAGMLPQLVLINLFGIKMIDLIQNPGVMVLALLMALAILLALLGYAGRKVRPGETHRGVS
jgi:uncharacterized membrane protein YdjX (TVP38/TMEM64 family)